jgi:hypothetical protein
MTTPRTVDNETCDRCKNPTIYRVKAVMGPPVFLCEDHKNVLSELYAVQPVEWEDSNGSI